VHGGRTFFAQENVLSEVKNVQSAALEGVARRSCSLPEPSVLFSTNYDLYCC